MRDDIFRNKNIDFSKAIRCSEFELILLEVDKISKKQYYHSDEIEFYEIRILKINPKSRIIKFINRFNIDKEDYESYVVTGQIPIYFNFFKNENLIITINNIKNSLKKGSIVNIFDFKNLQLKDRIFFDKKTNFSNLLIEFHSNYIKFKTKFDEEISIIKTQFNDEIKILNDDSVFFDFINESQEKDYEIEIATQHYSVPNVFEPYYIFTPNEWKNIISQNKIFSYKALDEKGNSFKKNLYHKAFITVTTNKWNYENIQKLCDEKDVITNSLIKEIERLSNDEYKLYLKKHIDEIKNIRPAKYEDPFPNHPEAWDNID